MDKNNTRVVIQAILFVYVKNTEDLKEGRRTQDTCIECREINKEGNQCREYHGYCNQEEHCNRVGKC